MSRIPARSDLESRSGLWGLELATVLSNSFGDCVDVTLIDKSDAFVFGYSKLDVNGGCV